MEFLRPFLYELVICSAFNFDQEEERSRYGCQVDLEFRLPARNSPIFSKKI
jgi:hypothetical protein